MKPLAFPIRVEEDGRLRRAELADSLLAIFGAMAATSSGWAHAPWFALQTVFEEARLELQDQPAVEDALNRALHELGIRGLRVHVRRAENLAPGERGFDVALASVDGTVQHRRLSA